MVKVLSTGLLLCVFLASSALAQEGDQPTQKELRSIVVGTWTLDLEKCKEHLDEATYERLPKGGPEMKLVFQDDGALKMYRGEELREVEYALESVDGSESEFKCQIEINGREMNATINLLDETTLKLAPDSGEPPAILTRPAKVYTLDEAKALLLGSWTCDPEATKALIGEEYRDDMNGLVIKFLKDGEFEAVENDRESPKGTFELSKFEMSESNQAESGDEEESVENKFALTTVVDDDEKSFSIQIVNGTSVVLMPTESIKIVFKRDQE